MNKLKRFKFPNGIKVMNYPVLLHGFSPWEDQVREWLIKMQERYGVSKTCEWHWEIRDGKTLNITAHKI